MPNYLVRINIEVPGEDAIGAMENAASWFNELATDEQIKKCFSVMNLDTGEFDITWKKDIDKVLACCDCL